MTQANSSLILHKGCRTIERDELDTIQPPEATRTWKPVSHSDLLQLAVRQMHDAGFDVARTKLGISPDKHRFFGTLDLTTQLADVGAVTLAVGLRNSTDKTFPMGFCAGSRVFVCDNLSFSADLMVKRKHTTHGRRLFIDAVGGSVAALPAFVEGEGRRISAMQTAELSATMADSLILRAATDRSIIPYRMIVDVLKHWQEPLHEAFQPRTVWSLFNAFTSAMTELKSTNPNDLAQRTMRLSGFLCAA